MSSLNNNININTMKIDYSKLNKKEVIELLKNQIEQNDALRDAKKTQEYAIEGLENRIEVIRELAAEKQIIVNALEARLKDEIEMHAMANEEIERQQQINFKLGEKKLKAEKKCREFAAEFRHIENLKKQGKVIEVKKKTEPFTVYGGSQIEDGLYRLNASLNKQIKELGEQLCRFGKENVRLGKELSHSKKGLKSSNQRNLMLAKTLDAKNAYMIKLEGENKAIMQENWELGCTVESLTRNVASLKRQVK